MAKEVSLVVKVKDEAGNVIKNIKDNVDGLKQSVDSVGDSVKKSDGFIGQFSRSLSEIGGKLKADIQLGAKAFTSMTGALKGAGIAAKGFGVALAATGITLVTAAVAALVSYFKNFEGAAKLVDKALAGVAAVGTQLVGIFKSLINLDFSGAADQIKGIGKAAIDAANGVDKLFLAQKNYAESLRIGTVQVAAFRQNIEKNKKILEDETLTYEQRSAALKELNRDTQSLGELELTLAENRKKEIQAELDIEKNFERQRELKQELAQATAEEINKQTELNNIKADAAKKEREIENKRKQEADKRREELVKAEKDATKILQGLRDENFLNAISDERKRAEESVRIQKERAIQEIELLQVSEESKRKLREEEETKATLALEKINTDYLAKKAEDDKKAAEKLANDEKKRNEERIEEERIATETRFNIVMSYYDSIATLGNILAQLAGESKALAIAGVLLEKGAAIAKVITSVQVANAGALATPQAILTSGAAAIPVITANKVAGAVSIAAIIAGAAQGIAQITQAQTDVNQAQSSTAPSSPATKFKKGGLLRGPSHEQGGILTPFGELEGGEFITNKFATQAFLPLLEQINRSGQNGMEPQPSSAPAMSPIIKTYVVASDMDSELEKRKKLNDLARL